MTIGWTEARQWPSAASFRPPDVRAPVDPPRQRHKGDAERHHYHDRDEGEPDAANEAKRGGVCTGPPSGVPAVARSRVGTAAGDP